MARFQWSSSFGRTQPRQPRALHQKAMSDEDAASAMAFAVDRFANEGAAAFALHSTEESLKALLQKTVSRVRALRSAVSSRQFDLVFQPIVRLDTRTLHHYEALSRFEDGGSPFETIRLAEGVHMIGEFDLAVVHRVVELLYEPHRRVDPALGDGTLDERRERVQQVEIAGDGAGDARALHLDHHVV